MRGVLECEEFSVADVVAAAPAAAADVAPASMWLIRTATIEKIVIVTVMMEKHVMTFANPRIKVTVEIGKYSRARVTKTMIVLSVEAIEWEKLVLTKIHLLKHLNSEYC